jgi:hypothetical protein
MTKFKGMFHLTKDEAKTIYKWLRGKRYDSRKDAFKIIFEPWEDEIHVSVAISHGNQTHWLELDDDSQERDTSIDTLYLGEHTLNLEINEEHYAPFLPILNKSVEEQVNAEIDPVISFVFIINKGICEVYVAGTKLGEHHLLKISSTTSSNKKCFEELSDSENNILTQDLSPEWPEENIPYFRQQDIALLIERLDLFGYEVYGIECWSSVDMGYFKTYVQEIYKDNYNIPIDSWFIDAYNRMLQEYSKLVLLDEPNNQPIFNISIGR